MERSRVGAFAVIALACCVAWVGCGDDDPAGGGGGGGSIGKTAVLTAGVYDFDFKVWTCGMTDTSGGMIRDTLCFDEAVTDLPFGPITIPCPVIETGTSLSLRCDFDVDVGGGCVVTMRADLSGSINGDTWTLTGEASEISDSPPDCSGPTTLCAGVFLEAVKTAEPLPQPCP